MSQATSAECPLSDREQTRNVLIVGVNTGLSYLASPVLYVDVMHTSLLDDLQRNAAMEPSANLSNSPMTAYMLFAVMPLFVAWLFPQIRLLRRILVLCYLALAIASAVMVGILLSPLPFGVKAAAVIAHGGVVATFRTVGVAFEFEVLGVAVSESAARPCPGHRIRFGAHPGSLRQLAGPAIARRRGRAGVVADAAQIALQLRRRVRLYDSRAADRLVPVQPAHYTGARTRGGTQAVPDGSLRRHRRLSRPADVTLIAVIASVAGVLRLPGDRQPEPVHRRTFRKQSVGNSGVSKSDSLHLQGHDGPEHGLGC